MWVLIRNNCGAEFVYLSETIPDTDQVKYARKFTTQFEAEEHSHDSGHEWTALFVLDHDPDTRPPICPCGIDRRDCTYHR